MRYLQLDFIRGIAIILMIIFHVNFDLNNFHFITIDIYNHHSRFWFYFRMIILTLFMLSVGISLALSHERGIETKKVFKRFLTLGVASLVITLATMVTFPHTWIYFGVLHFVTLASLIALLFLRLEWLTLLIGISIVALFNLNIISMQWLYNALSSTLYLPKHTEDLVPFTPWLGVVFIGLFIGKKRLFTFPLTKNRFTDSIALLGKHSLAIYLIHQPIFFGLIAGADFLLH